MRKFKLIKEFPLSPVKGTIATFKTMQEEIEGIYDMGAIPNLILTDCTQFPEFWEEVKEPLFVTEDGVEVTNKDTEVKLVNPVTLASVVIKAYQWDGTRKVFFFEKNAIKYIDENKPIYSKKQIKNAIEKAIYDSTLGYELTSTYHLNLELNL